MYDVARLAGVSQSTVSFVVNDRRDMRIPEETRARVLAAVEELGFRTNLAARGLRLQRTHSYGFITDRVASSPFAGQMVLGAQELAWENHHLLIVVNTDGDPALEKAAVETLLDRQVDGLIYASMEAREVDPPPRFTDVPSILVDCFPPGGRQVPCVVPMEFRGGQLQAQAVLEQGHERIAFLGGGYPYGAYAARERRRGFRAAMKRAGLDVDERLVLGGNYRMDSGYELTRQVLRERMGPTAIICGNDRMAVGALFALKEEGLRVPEDVSVVGYDDQEEVADVSHPPLTTVSLPHYAMGRRAVELLLGAPRQPIPDRTGVPGELIRRASVAPPAR